MSIISHLLRVRPLLWLAALMATALLVSLSWETATSYDDGGVGTAAFLVLGVAALPGQLLGLGYLGSAAAFVLLCVAGDLAIRAYQRSKLIRPAR
jgi:hypothetical protein